MNLRVKLHEFPETLLEAAGSIANHARLRVGDVRYNSCDHTVSFPLLRFPIVGKSLLRVTRHAKDRVDCRVTIRNVIECRIENHTEGLETIQLIFGLKIQKGEVFLSSAEEDRGIPCYTLSCRISELDIEIQDD